MNAAAGQNAVAARVSLTSAVNAASAQLVAAANAAHAQMAAAAGQQQQQQQHAALHAQQQQQQHQQQQQAALQAQLAAAAASQPVAAAPPTPQQQQQQQQQQMFQAASMPPFTGGLTVAVPSPSAAMFGLPAATAACTAAAAAAAAGPGVSLAGFQGVMLTPAGASTGVALTDASLLAWVGGLQKVAVRKQAAHDRKHKQRRKDKVRKGGCLCRDRGGSGLRLWRGATQYACQHLHDTG
jgi:hypothetical protein